jgi:SnoaL-like domain
MTNAETLVDRYLDTFNETDAGRRRALVDGLYADDGGYTDPNVDLDGREEIDGFLGATQTHFPGYRFSLGGPVDAHHGQARFIWHATPPDAAEPAYVGFDVIVAAGDRIRHVYGFIDPTPAD